MTKTKRTKSEAAPGRAALFGEDAYWLALLAQLSRQSAAEVFKELCRPRIRAALERRDVDPDKQWALESTRP